jgi:hypothetical protein
MRTNVALFALIVGASSPMLGQTLQGTWKPVQVVVDSGPNKGVHTSDVQPGLLIFTKQHYALLVVPGFTAREVPSDSASDEELGKSFLRFTANGGTYKRAGSTITLSPSVSKHPAVMAGAPYTMDAKVKGDTMWVTSSRRRMAATSTWVRIER